MSEWRKVVQVCEQILGCSDTASSPLSSNLPNMVRDIVVERDELRDKMAQVGPEPCACGLCGGPMSKNPHPDAGKPGIHVTVGAMYECIPCNRKALHGWSIRATKAESLVHKRERELVEWLERFDPDETLSSVTEKLRFEYLEGKTV